MGVFQLAYYFVIEIIMPQIKLDPGIVRNGVLKFEIGLFRIEQVLGRISHIQD